MESTLRSIPRGEVLLLQLENPSGFPRLERSLLDSLHRAIAEGEARRDVCGMVIAGTAQAFAAGAELTEVSQLTPLEALRFSAHGQSLMRRIEKCAKPVVVAIRGYCLGGGLDLALSCHARIAGDDAVFGHRGATLGLLTGWGGTALLPRMAGRARAMEMFVTGRTLSAAEAYAARIVTRVVAAEEVLKAAARFAQTCAHGDTKALMVPGPEK